MNYYAPEELSENRRLTPEGYLLIEGTPIARIGVQLYAPEELGYKIQPGLDGVVRIERVADEVFDPVSIASFNGKPFVNEHPATGLINPATWQHLALGVVLNPRRGTGDQRDLLLADILVQDHGAIGLIQNGKVELSCGYNANYLDNGDGSGKQVQIVGNHVALVSAGRCGPVCAIGDHDLVTRESGMAKLTYLDKMLKLFQVKTKDELMTALDQEVQGAAAEPVKEGEGAQHVHVHLGGSKDEKEDPMEAMGKRIGALEDGIKGIGDWVNEQRAAKAAADEEAAKKAAEGGEGEESEEEKAKKAAAADEEEVKEETKEETGDAKYDVAKIARVWQDTVALAEIIAPGIQVPVTDAAAPARANLTAICSHRRAALQLAALGARGRAIIEELNGSRMPDLQAMTCDAIRKTFLGAGAAMRRLNNGGVAPVLATSTSAGGMSKPSRVVRTVGDINRIAQERLERSRQAARH